jgi:hypothetical protein
MKAPKTLAALATLSLAGCSSYLTDFDDTPLPARTAITRAGRELEVEDGRLSVRTGPGEVGPALGVELAEDEGGVVVNRVVRASSPLRPDDRIAFVAPRFLGSRPIADRFAGLSGDALLRALDELETSYATEVAKRRLPLGEGLAADEVAAVAALYRLSVCQNLYYRGLASGDNSYATLETLGKAGLIDVELVSGKRNGYTIVCGPGTTQPGFFWLATAFPEQPGPSRSLYFAVNNEGIVSFSKSPFVVAPGTAELPSGLIALGPAPDLARDLPEPAELRKRGHAVRAIADLETYMVGLGWAHLDLVVEREKTPLIVRVKLERAPTESVPVVVYRGGASTQSYSTASGAFTLSVKSTVWRGVDFVRVKDLPEALRPNYADDDDVLVLRVARGSAAALVGIRPLDALSEGAAGAFTVGYINHDQDIVIRTRGGPKTIHLAWWNPLLEGHSDYWIPFVFSYQSDAFRTHIGLGPWDDVLHYSSKLDYNADLDGYVETSRFSLATVVQRCATSGPGGSKAQGGVRALYDPARWDYYYDWTATK